MEVNELASDLIKIGIPSLVALVGTLSSLLLAWWGHRQNILINSLQHKQSKEKERDNRTGELVKICASDLALLHDDFVNFSTILFAKIDTITCGDPWPAAEQELIDERFKVTLLSLSKHTAIKSYIMLLGDDELLKLHDSYMQVVGDVVRRYSIYGNMPIEDFDFLMAQSKDWHSQLSKRMSYVYLLK